MSIQVLMPALSPTMEEGKLAKWNVKEGDAVASGDVIAEIETDKATMEVEAVDEGRVGRLLVAEGTEGVKVNTPIAVLLEDGEDAVAETAAPAPAVNGAANGAANGADHAAPAAAAPVPAPAPAPVPAAAVPVDETPDWPEGTAMKTETVRVALRDAMAEEMRRDADVFVMGEEVAEYQGAYKITEG
ncbi:MAG: biotin/lipoyl-containing protein, partial [Pseudomonadota bacterium]